MLQSAFEWTEALLVRGNAAVAGPGGRALGAVVSRVFGAGLATSLIQFTDTLSVR